MTRLFRGNGKTIIGMVHLRPLPGTPFHEEGSFPDIVRTAVASARALADGGADGCLVQTVDRVYGVADESDPARTATMALVVRAIADEVGPDFPVGVQIMRNALRASIAVAKVAGGRFIRAGALIGRTVTPHGVVQADPLTVLAYRKAIGAEDVDIVADVDSMHFRPADSGMTTARAAWAAVQVGATAVSLGSPDEERALAMVRSVRDTVPGVPVVLAGHTTHANASRLLAEADGAFVGTCLEQGGWGGRIELERVREYVGIARGLEG
ncbi:MAG: BtpA/SgcQ family protein [Pseudonocardiaceae bacterium]